MHNKWYQYLWTSKHDNQTKTISKIAGSLFIYRWLISCIYVTTKWVWTSHWQPMGSLHNEQINICGFENPWIHKATILHGCISHLPQPPWGFITMEASPKPKPVEVGSYPIMYRALWTSKVVVYEIYRYLYSLRIQLQPRKIQSYDMGPKGLRPSILRDQKGSGFLRLHTFHLPELS